MPRRKWNLNTIYISERLQECLRPISRCVLTTVVAPMGYGKTTAVNWYLNERIKKDHGGVIRISIYTNNLPIFWKTVGKGTKKAGNATICKHVKIVNENIAGVLSHQFMA